MCKRGIWPPCPVVPLAAAARSAHALRIPSPPSSRPLLPERPQRPLSAAVPASPSTYANPVLLEGFLSDPFPTPKQHQTQSTRALLPAGACASTGFVPLCELFSAFAQFFPGNDRAQCEALPTPLSHHAPSKLSACPKPQTPRAERACAAVLAGRGHGGAPRGRCAGERPHTRDF
jgi:hypothetical protein